MAWPFKSIVSLGPSRDSLILFHSPGFKGKFAGPRRLAGSSAALSAERPERSSGPRGHPVELHAAGLEQERQPVERRMDHDLAGLVEEFIGQYVAVVERAMVVQSALRSFGAAAVLDDVRIDVCSASRRPRRGGRGSRRPGPPSRSRRA